MTSELVVDVQPKEVSIALLEDKSLVELQSEGRNISFSVGNMYLGRIKKLMPGLNACFVDVGYEKDAFLHYLDLGPQFNSLEKFVKQTLSDKKKLTSKNPNSTSPVPAANGTSSPKRNSRQPSTTSRKSTITPTTHVSSPLPPPT